MEQCPSCSAPVKPGAKFCPHCAYNFASPPQAPGLAETQIVQAQGCPNCGAAIKPGGRFCMNCAAPLGGPAYGNQAYGGQAPAARQYPNQYGAQPYPPGAARSSNATPIIIGAVVLVLLIGGGLATYFLLLKPSDGNTNRSVALMTNSNSGASTGLTNSSSFSTNTQIPRPVPTPVTMGMSPSETVQEFTRAAELGDADGMLKVTSSKAPGMDRMRLGLRIGASDIAKQFASKGGIDGVDVLDEQITGDTAKVTATTRYGNGQSATEVIDLVLEDGSWKIVLKAS